MNMDSFPTYRSQSGRRVILKRLSAEKIMQRGVPPSRVDRCPPVATLRHSPRIWGGSVRLVRLTRGVSSTKPTNDDQPPACHSRVKPLPTMQQPRHLRVFPSRCWISCLDLLHLRLIVHDDLFCPSHHSAFLQILHQSASLGTFTFADDACFVALQAFPQVPSPDP